MLHNNHPLGIVSNIPYKALSIVQRPAYLTNEFHMGKMWVPSLSAPYPFYNARIQIGRVSNHRNDKGTNYTSYSADYSFVPTLSLPGSVRLP
jgi:hypothetical protein